ncbi:MAG: sigma-54-dependent Fis family transcriptional regulator [Steroidobacteraceae bacterium]|nr:sigma-54-dependent Fis family transcriptional regulator [Steroidobacteraceae bacterium]
MQPRILIADDQADILSALKLLLKREGYEVTTATSPAGVLDVVAREHVDVALVDLNYTRDTTSGEEGLALVEQLHRLHPELPIVVMTAWASVEVAVRAMRQGANDFLEKPWNNQRLLSLLANQVKLAEARQRGRRLADENAILRAGDDGTLIASSRPMQDVVRLARQVAPSDASVLITGEPGTGKSLLAKLMHDWSARAEKSFISVNAGGLPETVFESEMFGHVRGAFTDAKADRAGRFELADGGTLFLDEIGNVPPAQQARLLRALETGEFERVGSSRTQRANVRVISATNADLPAMIADGRFREDLLFRINTVEIRLPPLRERREEILELATAQLARKAAQYGRAVHGFDAVAIAALQQYAWPGNVRELNSVVERSVLLAAGPEVGVADLRLSAVRAGPPSLEEMSLEDAERALIRSALRRNGGSVPAAAEALGLSRSAMYRRLEKLGLKPDEL